MPEYVTYLLIFLTGYAVGKAPFIYLYLKTRSENLELKKDVIILKHHLQKYGRGRVVPAQEGSNGTSE